MTKKRKILVLALLVIAILCMGMTSVFLYKNRNAVKLISSKEIKSHNEVCFYQKDEKWKTESLGESKYNMGNSGCLTTCIASLLLMQNIYPYELPAINPYALNVFFSDNNVYDSEGNLQWEKAEQALNVDFISVESSEITSEFAEFMLAENVYPIVCVKMPKSGNYHFVLLVGSDNDSFLCMDPLNKNNELIPLSKFNNKIYSLRYCQQDTPKGSLDERIIDECKYYKVVSSNFLYSYEIYDESGKTVKSDKHLMKAPHLSMPSEHLVKFTYQAGTGLSTQWGFYYDTQKDVFSRFFTGGLYDECDNRTVFPNYSKLIVRDIFDKTKYYKEISSFENEFSKTVEPFVDVKFIDEDKISVTYLTGDDYKEVTEVIDLKNV